MGVRVLYVVVNQVCRVLWIRMLKRVWRVLSCSVVVECNLQGTSSQLIHHPSSRPPPTSGGTYPSPTTTHLIACMIQREVCFKAKRKRLCSKREKSNKVVIKEVCERGEKRRK